MKNLKFVFILAFLISASLASYAQQGCMYEATECSETGKTCMEMEKCFSDDGQLMSFSVTATFDDSNSNELRVYRNKRGSSYKTCTESPCTVTLSYSRNENYKERKIVCRQVSDENAEDAEKIGCIVVVAPLAN